MTVALVAVDSPLAAVFARGRVPRSRAPQGRRARSSGGRPDRRRWASRSELAALLDPGELLEHTLAEVAALPGVDAALAVLEEDGAPHGGARDLRRRGGSHRTPGAAEHEPPALEVFYRYRLDDAAEVSAGRAPAWSSAPRRRPVLGSLAALSRSSSARFFDGGRRRARGHRPPRRPGARHRQALRGGEAARRAGLAHRPLQPPRVPRRAAARGRARAPLRRRLALVVLDLDGRARQRHAGHLAGDAVLAEVGRRILSLVRATDIACRFGGDEFAVILPESARPTPQLPRPIASSRASREEPVEKVGPVGASAGIAELTSDDAGADSSTARTSPFTAAKDAGKRPQRRRAQKQRGRAWPGLAHFHLPACVSRRAASRPPGSPPPRRRLTRHLVAPGWPPNSRSP